MALDATQMRKVDLAIREGRGVPPKVLAEYNKTLQAARQGVTNARPSNDFDSDNVFGLGSPGPAEMGFEVDARGGGIMGPVIRFKIPTQTITNGQTPIPISCQAAFNTDDQYEVGGDGNRKLVGMSCYPSVSGTLPAGYSTLKELEDKLFRQARLEILVAGQTMGHVSMKALKDTEFAQRYLRTRVRLDGGNFLSTVLKVTSATNAPVPATGSYTVDWVIECNFDVHPSQKRR